MLPGGLFDVSGGAVIVQCSAGGTVLREKMFLFKTSIKTWFLVPLVFFSFKLHAMLVHITISCWVAGDCDVIRQTFSNRQFLWAKRGNNISSNELNPIIFAAIVLQTEALVFNPRSGLNVWWHFYCSWCLSRTSFTVTVIASWFSRSETCPGSISEKSGSSERSGRSERLAAWDRCLGIEARN